MEYIDMCCIFYLDDSPYILAHSTRYSTRRQQYAGGNTRIRNEGQAFKVRIPQKGNGAPWVDHQRGRS